MVILDKLESHDTKKIYQNYQDGKLNKIAELYLVFDETVSLDITYDFRCQPSLWENPKNFIYKLMSKLHLR